MASKCNSSHVYNTCDNDVVRNLNSQEFLSFSAFEYWENLFDQPITYRVSV